MKNLMQTRKKTSIPSLLRIPGVVSALILLLLFHAMAVANAARSELHSGIKLPTYYPNQFQHTGMISSLENDNSIIISGLRYKIASYLKLHTSATEYATRRSLRAGDEVGFSTMAGYNNSLKVTELWVLPKGSVKLK